MNDHVVDTNVLLVASAAHPYSPFSDTHVPPDERRQVFEWLCEFRADETRRMVLDQTFKIYDEYRNKLTDQDYGLQVISAKMENMRTIAISLTADGHADVPEDFSDFDPSDCKFLAVALADPSTIAIVNAADSDWLDVEAQLASAGVNVVHIIETWLRKFHGSRK